MRSFSPPLPIGLRKPWGFSASPLPIRCFSPLGSTRRLTNAQGQAIAGYSYDAFGALHNASGPTTPFLFTGEQRNPGTGLYYLRARYYAPATGRFLTRDPFPGFALDPVGQ